MAPILLIIRICLCLKYDLWLVAPNLNLVVTLTSGKSASVKVTVISDELVLLVFVIVVFVIVWVALVIVSVRFRLDEIQNPSSSSSDRLGKHILNFCLIFFHQNF